MRGFLCLLTLANALLLPDCEIGTWHPAPLELLDLAPSQFLPGCPGFVPCPLGSSCTNGVRTACAPGTYTASPGSTSCTACPGGSQCPAGVALPCGPSALFFCPPGSAAALQAGPGYYTLPESSPVAARSASAPCTVGSYCEGGVKALCPRGRFGSQPALSAPGCSGPCAAGHACPAGSVSPTQLACGSLGAEAFCPVGSTHGALAVLGSGSEPSDFITQRSGLEQGLQQQQQITTARLDGLTGLAVAGGGAQGLPCPQGYFCTAAGLAQPCPAGRAGTLLGATEPLCDAACEQGFFCAPGSTSPRAAPCGSPAVYCPAGSATPQPASPGYFTFSTVSTGSLPSELTRTGQAPCPPGQWCASGLASPCPAGHNATQPLQSSPACQGQCSAGFACPAGTAAPSPCTDPSTFCPPGSEQPMPVSPGYAATLQLLPSAADGSQLALSIGQTPCAMGSYCTAGLQLPCPAGRWGGALALATPACSGACSASYYCAPGSTSPTQRACGGVGVFCPEGSRAPTPVPPGHFSTPQGTASSSFLAYSPLLPPALLPAHPASCPAAWAASAEAAALHQLALQQQQPALSALGPLSLQPALLSANASLRTAAQPCPPGSTCQGGLPHPCPAGRWSSSSGSEGALCPGVCRAGWYCPLGSFTGTQVACGHPSLVCAAGSGQPTVVPPGWYSGGGLLAPLGEGSSSSLSPSASEAQLLPPVLCGGDASNASALLAYPTAAAAAALHSSAFFTSGAAASGSSWGWWPLLQRTPCLPAGGLGAAAAGAAVEACQGSELGGPSTRSWMRLCPPGHWCSSGSLYACPGGRYGEGAGAAALSSCGPCAAGWVCPPGSTSPTAQPCAPSPAATAAFFCPPASAAPQPVAAGYMTLPANATAAAAAAAAAQLTLPQLLGRLSDPAALPAARVAQVPCPAGHTCSAGLARPCPPGRYSDAAGGEAREQCAGPCAAGFVCGPGSSSPWQQPCGSSAHFCPEGASAPTPVAAGHYSTGSAPALPALAAANATRTGQLLCQAGWWCAQGIARECSAGRYGSSPGLTQAGCSGACAPGHFCPPGSTSPTPFRCGDVYSVLVDVLSSLPAQAALAGDPTLPDTDALPMASPSYSPAALAALYRALLCSGGGGGAGCQAPPVGVGVGGGDGQWGQWRAASSLPVLPAAGSAPEALQAAVYGAVGVGHGSPGASPAAQLQLTLWARQQSASLTALVPLAALGSGTLRSLLLAVNSSSSSDGEGVGGWGSNSGRSVLQVASLAGAGVYNFTASIHWHGGQRLRLPSLTLPIDSFAALHRVLLVGGPSAVHCPAGSAWPLPTPPGFVTSTSQAAAAAALAAANASSQAAAAYPLLLQAGAGQQQQQLPNASEALAEALAAIALNTTADGAVAAAPGWYAAGGRAEPCQPGTFSAAAAAASSAACAFCPAGSSCGLGAAAPTPCAEGFYAVAGSAACTQCPAPYSGSAGLVAPANQAEAERQWPLGQQQDLAGTLGLPSAPTLVRCKTSVRCCE